jgi:hypothetical protein
MTSSNRRTFLKTTTLAAASLASSAPLSAWAEDGTADVQKGAESAYIWGYPLVLTERYLKLAADAGYETNRFTVSTELSTPADKVAGPNVDTLYGFAWIDLSAEPLVVHVPETNDRYYSIQLIDAYANSFQYIGRRATGTHEGRYALVGPGWKGSLPAGVKRVDAPTHRVLALTRVLVRSKADIVQARAIQNQFTLTPLSRLHDEPVKPRTGLSALNVFPIQNLGSEGSKYFDELNAGLRVDPPSVREVVPTHALRQIGIGGQKDASASAGVLNEAASSAAARIKAADYSTNVNGWKVDYKIRPFIKDNLERAAANLYGPGAHVAEEALYFSGRADSAGAPLSGGSRYRVRFAHGQLPPVDAFWSLILYGPDFALVENPIHRYAVNDRTEGLKFGPDGSLEIAIQNAPSTSPTANWLPAPAGGYSLILRTYQPRPEVLDQRWKPPAIEKLG